MLVSLGLVNPDCPKSQQFRLPNRTIICKDLGSSRRGTSAFSPRRSEVKVFEANRNRGYTKVRNIIKQPKVFGISRFNNRIKRTKRSIRLNKVHEDENFDRAAARARIRAQQPRARIRAR